MSSNGHTWARGKLPLYFLKMVDISTTTLNNLAVKKHKTFKNKQKALFNKEHNLRMQTINERTKEFRK